jgi:hypothetical protein
MSKLHALEKPTKGLMKAKGQFTMAFTVQCGVCDAHEVFSANNIDQAMRFAQENGWRISDSFGWVHCMCSRRMPAPHALKFKPLVNENA